MSETCIKCKFYRKETSPAATKLLNESGEYREFYRGACRKHSPTKDRFPVTRDEEWCGDYEQGTPQFWKSMDGSILITQEEAELIKAQAQPVSQVQPEQV